MWIVRVALDRPYTFIVLALLILIASPVVIARTPTDIFPAINIPVIAVAWQYSGLNTEELEGRITTSYERVLTTTVDNIQRIESTTVNGQAIIKVYLQPNARLDTANAQITAISQTVLRQYPPGTTPPLIINFSASSVPILQLALSGDPTARTMLSEVEMENPSGEVLPGAYVVVRLRVGLATRGMTIPANALLFRSEGLRVAIVRGGRAELVPVKLGRDYGRTVEVVAGLTPADAVILDPADSLVSGTAVRVRPSAPAKTGG